MEHKQERVITVFVCVCVCSEDACTHLKSKQCIVMYVCACTRIYVSACVHICVCVVVLVSWHTCGGQKTALWAWFSAPTLLRQGLSFLYFIFHDSSSCELPGNAPVSTSHLTPLRRAAITDACPSTRLFWWLTDSDPKSLGLHRRSYPLNSLAGPQAHVKIHRCLNVFIPECGGCHCDTSLCSVFEKHIWGLCGTFGADLGSC